jgi:hypothetical protein
MASTSETAGEYDAPEDVMLRLCVPGKSAIAESDVFEKSPMLCRLD